ncbi:hypothetical protein DFQ30_011439 [Apophysomyces sp. BC1015]|nr:hypothetical protein DFQ30_011439 [Apophysomyces sp. BC1015]
MPDVVKAGARVEVKVGVETVLVGHVDQVRRRTSKHEKTLTISGRDDAAILRDCSAPIFTAKQVSLAEVVTNIVRPLGIKKIRIDTARAIPAWDKISIDPGDTAWDALAHAAEGEGLWPWFEPDGTLVVGGPDYSTPPVASLILREDGEGNNVEWFDEDLSIAERHSESHGTYSTTGQAMLKATVKDKGMAVYRPKVYVDHDAPSLAAIESRARKIISDSALAAHTLRASVKGHRTSSGVLWKPGQRVHVVWEEYGIDAIYFLMARRFTGGRPGGTHTQLTLKEDGVWDINKRIARALSSVRQVFRGVIGTATTHGPVVVIRGTGLADENLPDLELFQQYGLTSVPPAGTMMIVAPIGGKTSHGIVVATEHGQYRFKALQTGEVALYTDEGDSIVLARGRAVNITTNTLNIKADESVTIDAPKVDVTHRLNIAEQITGQGGMAVSGGDGMSIDGGMKISGDIEIGGKSFLDHRHSETGDAQTMIGGMDVLLDPRTGGYTGTQTATLANSVYIRLATPVGAWWAAPEVGSLLHTLAREKDRPRVQRLAVQYAEQALAPLIDDGRAIRIAVTSQSYEKGWLMLLIEVHEAAGNMRHFQHPVKVS